MDNSTPCYYMQANGLWKKGAAFGAGAKSLKYVLRQGGKIEGSK